MVLLVGLEEVGVPVFFGGARDGPQVVEVGHPQPVGIGVAAPLHGVKVPEAAC